MTHWFFKDKSGQVVIWQKPNLAIILWAVFAVTSRLFDSSLAVWLATAFLFTWAFMELTQGVNYFRRLLGLVVLAAIIAARF
jgi:hypothetical protein